jgi:isopentenyl-diphosphate delta-isomerase
VKIPLIASGGLRTGLECAKALAMGASLSGFALPLLKPAMESHHAVARRLEGIARELRKAMLLVGARSIQELSRAEISSTG